jgi:hypothetical protein
MENKLSTLQRAILQKKGAAQVSGKLKGLIGSLVFIVILVQLAPTFFTGLGSTGTGLANATAYPAVPTWLPTVLIILVAAGLIYAAFEVFT